MKILSETFSPLRTIKKWAVCAVLVFVCAGANAQSTDFDKLEKIDGVEYQYIGKEMIALAAKQGEGLHVGDIDLKLGDGKGDEFLKKLDNVKVFTCEEKGSIKKFKKTALKLLKGQEVEEPQFIADGLPLEVRSTSIDDAAVYLADAVGSAGNDFSENQTQENLEKFKTAVSQFIRFVVVNNFDVNTAQRKRRFGKNGQPPRMFFFSDYVTAFTFLPVISTIMFHNIFMNMFSG